MNGISWILFVARRYFRTKRKEKGHASSLFAVAGIAVGVMTLIAVLAVMNGFQLGFIEDILEVSSYHIRLTTENSETLTAQIISEIRSLDGVRAVLPFSEVQTIGRGAFSDTHGMLIRGVPVNTQELDPGLMQKLDIIRGSFDLSETGSIVLGSELAQTMGLSLGDTITLLSLGGGGGGIAGALRARDIPFTVTGIFRSGYYLFDLGWGFVSAEDAAMFLPENAQPVWGVKIDDRFADRRYVAEIAAILKKQGVRNSVKIVSWREYNSAFFGALRMEKTMMMFLVGLIFIVVGVNIYHALKRSVYEKTEEIGVLSAVGAKQSAVQAVFVLEGVLIGVIGAIIGLLLGLLIATRINEVFSLIESVVNVVMSGVNLIARPFFGDGGSESFTLFSPLYFYLTEIPSRVLFPEALFIFMFAVLSATGAAYFASLKISGMKPADVLRYE